MKKTAKTILAVIKKVCEKFAEKITFGEVLFSINNNC